MAGVDAQLDLQVEMAQAVLLKEASSQDTPTTAVSKAVIKIIPEAWKTGQMRMLTNQEKVLLELGARSALASMAASAVAAGQPVMQWSAQANAAPTVQRLLDMFLLITEQKWSDSGLIFTLMEDLVETSTMQDCSGVFTYLESHSTQLLKPRAYNSGRFTTLRICNLLLRRLSKTHDAVLCGRVLIFLAHFQTLSDRSGLNIQAAFNLGNVTAVEDVPEGATDSNGDLIDREFYKRFWGLQSVFYHPMEAMVAGPWAKAMADLQAVIAEFDSLKLIASAPGAPDPSGPLPAVKYLSSSKLMRLQLQDSGFRRQFLVQALIFLHCCRHPGRIGRGVTLKPNQLEEAQRVEAALYRQLEATPERGTEFAAAIRAVLSDETYWVQWKSVVPAGVKPGQPPKVEGLCPSFERPLYVPPNVAENAVAVTGQVKKRQRVESQPLPQPDDTKRLRIGSPTLDRLWNQAPNNMAGLKVSERRHLPTLREYLDPVIEDMKPENGIEDAFKTKHDKAYQWKALRMISRESLTIFAKTAIDSDLEVAARGFFPTEVPLPPPAATPTSQAQQETPSSCTAHSLLSTGANSPISPAVTLEAAGSPPGQSTPAAASKTGATQGAEEGAGPSAPASTPGLQTPTAPGETPAVQGADEGPRPTAPTSTPGQQPPSASGKAATAQEPDEGSEPSAPTSNPGQQTSATAGKTGAAQGADEGPSGPTAPPPEQPTTAAPASTAAVAASAATSEKSPEATKTPPNTAAHAEAAPGQRNGPNAATADPSDTSASPEPPAAGNSHQSPANANPKASATATASLAAAAINGNDASAIASPTVAAVHGSDKGVIGSALKPNKGARPSQSPVEAPAASVAAGNGNDRAVNQSASQSSEEAMPSQSSADAKARRPSATGNGSDIAVSQPALQSGKGAKTRKSSADAQPGSPSAAGNGHVDATDSAPTASTTSPQPASPPEAATIASTPQKAAVKADGKTGDATALSGHKRSRPEDSADGPDDVHDAAAVKPAR